MLPIETADTQSSLCCELLGFGSVTIKSFEVWSGDRDNTRELELSVASHEFGLAFGNLGDCSTVSGTDPES